MTLPYDGGYGDWKLARHCQRLAHVAKRECDYWTDWRDPVELYAWESGPLWSAINTYREVREG